MRNQMVFGGKNMAEFGAYVATSNFLDSPSRDVTTVQIPGRNGDLHIDNGRFNNFELRVQLYIMHDMKANMDALRNFLNASAGAYLPYAETLCPNEYRMACFRSAFVPSDYDRIGGAVTLVFDCKPQRYLTVGNAVRIVTDTLTLENPTMMTAHPAIEVTGQGSFEINGNVVTVGGDSATTVIDSEMMTCTNREVTMDDYPTLKPGTNAIVVDGVTLKITPRWWRL